MGTAQALVPLVAVVAAITFPMVKSLKNKSHE